MSNKYKDNLPEKLYKNLNLPYPHSKELPFFAYGFLKPGEIGYDVVSQYVESYTPVDLTLVEGYNLYLKDGLPVVKKGDSKVAVVHGSLINFKRDYIDDAYENIAIMINNSFYSWKNIVIKPNDVNANMLVLRKSVENKDPQNMSLKSSVSDCWKSKDDLFFFRQMINLKNNIFVKILNKDFETYDKDLSIDISLKLQDAYWQLWTIIDRFCTMKYWIDGKYDGDRAGMLLTNDLYFITALQQFNNRFLSYKIGKVFYSCDDGCVIFNNENCIKYYYAVRCNVVHRGKGFENRDINILKYAFLELFAIMWAVVHNKGDYSLIDEVKKYAERIDSR